MIPRETIDDILHRLDIVDVIQRYVPLTRKGKSFVGLCPFHEDGNPSLSVSREKQIFKCFSCGTAGNSISFLQKYKNISYMEAVQEAAQLADVTLPQSAPARQDPQRLRKLELNQELMKYANHILHTEDGEAGLRYLQQRGYTKELIDQQQLGHIPEKEKLLNFLEKKGYSRQELIEADVFSPHGSCKWEGRILYPIITAHGEVRGFTARTIGKVHDQPKYVNTSESTIFAKRKLLYGGTKAIEAARQKHELIIVEGSADVDMLTQAGYLNCVATLGTALTEDHVQALKRMNVRIRLCYDGDAAGIKATIAAALLLRKNGILPFCTSLPLGKDPDELIRQAPQLLQELLSTQENTVDFLLQHPNDLSDFSKRKEYAVNVMKELISYHDPLMKEHYLRELSRKSGFSIASLQDSYEKMSVSKPQYTAVRSQRFAKSEFHQEHRNVRINFQEKDKVIYKNEVQQKFDNLQQDGNVIAFDRSRLLERTDILRKYIGQKGRLLETTITCITDDDIDLRCHSITESCVRAISEEHHMDARALNYIAYLHKDTRYPHIHLQIWQEEPLLERYRLTNTLLEKLRSDVIQVMESPLPIQKTETEAIIPEAMKLPGM